MELLILSYLVPVDAKNEYMRVETRERLKDLIETYERATKVMEHGAKKAIREEGRAYGGFIRSQKGQLQEFITTELIGISWVNELKKAPGRLVINSEKIQIPIRHDYIIKIANKTVRDYIFQNIRRFYYGLSVDRHVFVDGTFIMGIECKAYAENAMLKRILVDFHLLKTKTPDLICYLFQLESQLGGDYSILVKEPKGSFSSHSLMSYFQNVDLQIITLLPGERKVERPINKPDFFKPLPLERLENAVDHLVNGFERARVK
jgi:hypothetical protein